MGLRAHADTAEDVDVLVSAAAEVDGGVVDGMEVLVLVAASGVVAAVAVAGTVTHLQAGQPDASVKLTSVVLSRHRQLGGAQPPVTVVLVLVLVEVDVDVDVEVDVEVDVLVLVLVDVLVLVLVEVDVLVVLVLVDVLVAGCRIDH